MKDSMKKFALPIICAVSAVILSLVNLITAPKISEYENGIAMQALNEVAKGYEYGERVEVSDNQYVTYYYSMTDSAGKLYGYIVGLKTSGYGGEMTLVSSFDKDGKIVSVKMLTNNETPGVGKKSENESYMNMFIGKGSANNPIPSKKDMLDDGSKTFVSGATLTFSGISKALSAGSDFIKTL